MVRGRKPVRVLVNPVTHELERTVLDAVQLGFERAVGALDAAGCAMPTTASRPWYDLVREAAGVLAALEADAEVPGLVEPLLTLAREYAALDAAGRFRFAAKVRERLGRMVPHSGAA